jgi:hypothetical protein
VKRSRPKTIQRTDEPTREVQDRRARMRVQIAQETGRSPFDPKVVREARHRVAQKLDAEIARALRDPLPAVLNALRDIHDEGRFGNRKVFIAALWDRIGRQVGMSLLELKRWLIEQHRQRRLELARADLIAAMPYDMVRRSEAHTEGAHSGATFHFVIDPSI